ncbi:MAG: DNA mismatch repair endonuclease MutL, partial [Planctomycetota bacterium]
MEKSRAIRVLSPEVVNKISAGEVVERPASVVKELVENALDAGAGRIEIQVEEGGRRLVRIVDDGCGMGAGDLELVFAAHATSKLGAVEDLEQIATLGFRGEALASIGAVSQASILSRTAQAEQGYAVHNRGGEIVPPRAAGAAPGTEVAIRNLFFNTPARAKFLRTVRTELGHIEDLVTRFCLAFPEVGFRLVHDGCEVLQTPPGEDRRTRLESLYGRELSAALIPVSAAAPGARLEGFLAGPAVTRSHARDMLFFLNGRHIRDRILLRVVRDAYRDVLHHGRYPVVFLFMDVDPSAVDVNVHPTKAEVRWRDPKLLHMLVAPALRRALVQADLAQPVETGEHAERVRGAVESYLGGAGAGYEYGRGYGQGHGHGHVGEGQAELTQAGAPRVFQVHDSYLVCEVPDGIAIVDQHALHERVQYDRILRKLTEGGVVAQRLLVAEEMEVSASDLGLLEEGADLLRRCGFEWSVFGERSIALEATPAAVVREQAPDVLRDLLGLLRARGGKTGEIDGRTLFHEVAGTMACKAAVRFGDRLNREEAQALLEESGALERAFVCPHGRPTVL